MKTNLQKLMEKRERERNENPSQFWPEWKIARRIEIDKLRATGLTRKQANDLYHSTKKESTP